MCGISGFIGNKLIDQNVVNRTLVLMKNRGPDNQDWISFNNSKNYIYLLHSRLSIIDLEERSNQPFSIGNYTIVFNGEIYNYIELRDELKKCGHVFQTLSDTEVLLRCFIEYGKRCVEKFNGMWSFAIWDDQKKKLFLSRDRFAEKPLYYFQDSDGFYFGSEIKFLRSLSNRNFEINYDHLKRYLVYGYKFLYKTRDTYFNKINELSFASNAIVDNDLNYKESSYWVPKVKIKNMSMNDAIEGTRYYLEESVKLRLRADVPLAFCLSGGVDSAALASIAKKTFNYDVATFSIIDKDERYNELDNIQYTIDDISCKHELIYLGNSNMLERLKSLIHYHDEPVATISYLVHSLLSEKINDRGYKISISGTAADELFTGYYDHFNLHLYEMRNHPEFQEYLNDWENNTGKYIRNPYLKNPKLYFDDQSIRDHNHLNSDIFNDFLIDGLTIEINENNFSDSLLRNRMLNELFYEVTRVILNEDDLNSMKYSIENRSPYLDTHLFDFAYSIPSEHLIKNGYAKFVLREAVKETLNKKVRLDRRKKGFNASINSIFNLSDKKTTNYLLADSPLFDMIKKEKVEELLKKDFFENSYNKFIFNLLNVKLFLEEHSN